MANTILTPTAVTRAVAVVLHQKAKFLKRINQQYDAQTPDGRKAGGSIKIRMPNEFAVRRTSVMQTQDISEVSETLTIAQPFGVDFNFSDSDLALSLEDFTKRVIEPAVKVLVSNIEAYFITDFANAVANLVDDDGQAISYYTIQKARQKLIENLAPDDDEDLSLFLSPKHNARYLDATKGLFSPVGTLSAQYKSGMVGPVAGVGWIGSSTHLTDHATGTAVQGDTSYKTDIAGGEAKGTAGLLHVDGTTTTWKAGDVFEIEDVNAVHAETKVDLGYRKQLVVTSDFDSEGDMPFSVGIGGASGLVSSGARQNVSAAPVDGKIIYKVGAGASEKLNNSLYFHKDAYAVAFADLENPKKYGAWGDVQVVDDISVRVWRQGDIINGKFPGRLDVLAGGKCIRPQLGCRMHADG